jgi:ABC-type transporter Mla MlaB component
MLYADILPATREAAILFAANHAAAAEELLHARIEREGRANHEAWIMLLEILHLSGKRAAFDDLSRRYAGMYGFPAPAWGFPARVDAPGTFELEGTIGTAAQIAGLGPHARGLKTVAIDMSQVARIEFGFTGIFCEALRHLQQGGRRVILANIAELHASLLEAFGETDHLVLLRRSKGEARRRGSETGAWAPLPSTHEVGMALAA